MPDNRRFTPPGKIGVPTVSAAAVVVGVSLFAIAAAAQDTAVEQDASAQLSETAPLAAQSLLLDAARTGDTVVVVGDRGHVLVSDAPRASDWMQIVVPTRAMLTAVAARGEQLWAVGHDAVILHSMDSGRNWTLQNYAPDLEAPLLDVWFDKDGHGFAVGAYGLIYETFDAGTSWKRRSVDESEPHFYDLFETATRDLVLVGEFGTILKSGDRGETWSRLDTPYQGTFFGGLGLSDGTIMIFGLRGNLYRSKDEGDSWQKIETNTTASLLGGIEDPGGNVRIVGLSGTLLTGRNTGAQMGHLGGLGRTGFSSLLLLDDGGLLLVGEDGVELLVNATAGDAVRRGQQ